MKAEAIPAGERLIEQETKLDELFANREITPAALTATTAAIGTTQARLREAHLKYHLAMMDVLTPAGRHLPAASRLRVIGATAPQGAPLKIQNRNVLDRLEVL